MITSHYDTFVVSRALLITASKRTTMDKISCAKRQRKRVWHWVKKMLCEMLGWQEVKVQHLWAIIMGSMNRLCDISVKASQISMQVLPPALHKVQTSHSSPVILILKGWKKRLIFGLRTKHRKKCLWVDRWYGRNNRGFTNVSTRQLGLKAPFQPWLPISSTQERTGLRNSKEGSASKMSN